MILWQALVIGGVFASAAVLMYAALVPAPPELRSTVERIRGAAPTAVDPSSAHRWDAARRRFAPGVVSRLGLTRYSADLAVLDMGLDDLAIRKVGYGMAGAAFPVALAAAIGLMGVRIPFLLSAAAIVASGGVLFFVPDLDVRRSARAARERMRQAVCLYLELVALERLADAGSNQALERAAMIGTTREHALIRRALLEAEVDGRPAWTALVAIAERTGVRELDDVGDIMRVAGADGASVYTTLRARAQSLRTQLLNSSRAAANAASEHMVIPVSLLGVVFMGLIAYPALVRIIFG